MTSSDRIANIQLLRGIAAFLVVAEHAKNAVTSVHLKTEIAASPLSIFPFGIGVDIFFVISGFVMAYSSERLHGAAGAWRDFLWRRLIRVAPLYWATTAALIIFFIITRDAQWRDASWWSVIGSFLFIPTLNSAGHPLPIYSVGWTLNHEMFFYVIFAVFVGLPARRAVAAITVTILTLVAFGIIVDPRTPILDVWSASIMIEFVLGIGLYELHRAGMTRLPAGVAVAASVVAVAAMARMSSDPGEARAILWGGPAALIVLAALSLPSAPRRISNFLGDTSYGVYLVHVLVILALSSIFRRWLPDTDVVWFALFPAAVVVSTLATASVAHRFIERPAMKLLRPSKTPALPSSDDPGPIGATPAT